LGQTKDNKKEKMKANKKIIIAQVIFLMIVGAVLFLLYPKAKVEINGNLVKINSGNANLIIISESPDFSNPRYLELNNKTEEFNLAPGTYYWKASNSYINGLKNKFTIESEVGLKIDDKELVNIGNVKLNVSEGENGVMVGHIILEPEESEKIENKGEYIGRQE